MAKLELKYDILLKMKENLSMTPDKLEGNRKANEIAILELKEDGLVSTIGCEFGGIILFSLTERGLIKQKKLLEELSESKAKKFGKWFNKTLKLLKGHIIEIIIGVVVTVLGTLVLTYIQN